MRTLKIFGPPGTGKTYTLLQKFENELKTVSPKNLGFMTFTRAARLEALSRASLPEDDLPFVKTIHATCYKALKISQDQLVMRKDLKKFGQSIGVQLTGFMPDLFALETITDKWQQPTKADRLLQLNHLGRHRGFKLRDTLKDAPVELDYAYAKWFTRAYRDWKTKNGLLDYTDLLTEYIRIGDPLDLEVLFVDEGQDLSWLQWQVIHKLGANCSRTYICGDDDQSIFVWAGASASMFNMEPADDVIVLPQSYRLPRIVHELSQRIIRRVKVRQEKTFLPRDADGIYKPVGNLDLQHVSEGSSLVLFRNFHRGQALAAQLESLGVPFTGANSVLSSPEIQAALNGWNKVQNNQPIPTAEAEALIGFSIPGCLTEHVKGGFRGKSGEVSATAIFTPGALDTKEWWKVLPRLPHLGYLQVAMRRAGLAGLLNPAVRLLSIHQSKGLQADTVVLDLEMARRTYMSYQANPDDEHRVQYVAVTRTKERLLTLLPTEGMSYQI